MTQIQKPKPYCEICGKELEGFEVAWGWQTCHDCGSRRFRLRKEEERGFSDDEPIPYTVTEKGWNAG